RRRQGTGPGDALRDPRYPPLPGRGAIPLLRPAGPLRPRVGRHEAGHRRPQDRQCPPEMGVFRSHLPLAARISESQGLAQPPPEEARQEVGPGGAGGTAGTRRVSPVAQRGSLRRRPLLRPLTRRRRVPAGPRPTPAPPPPPPP